MRLEERLRDEPYEQYSYAYPHKTAYRALDEPVQLASHWAGEPRDALFGYVHVAFCSYRCGFCNLFALGRPEESLVDSYLAQLARQIEVVARCLGNHRFARFAVGGGTPSYLDERQLGTLFDSVSRAWNIDLAAIPAGIEFSPETATPGRLAVCRQAGMDRVSMGVQSFVDAELAALLRPTPSAGIIAAIEAIRGADFPTLNLDLIYGIEGQTTASLAHSVAIALEFAPEEIYLYPLYVRPRTGLDRVSGRREAAAVDARPALYRAARAQLLDAGYTQVSMRMFRAPHARETGGPAYCCQNDGMVGVGAGARSYTRALHYSDLYAVARGGVYAIIRDYVQRPPESFAEARYGFILDSREQRRRFVIQSLLTWPGLDEQAYASRFGTRPLDDLPELAELVGLGLARREGGVFALEQAGMAHADAIGPWLASPAVTARMRSSATA